MQKLDDKHWQNWGRVRQNCSTLWQKGWAWTPMKIRMQWSKQCEWTENVWSKIPRDLQHLIPRNGIKGILEIQGYYWMICSHIQQKPPLSMESSLSSTSYPQNRLYRTHKGNHLISITHLLTIFTTKWCRLHPTARAKLHLSSHQRCTKKQALHLCWHITLERYNHKSLLKQSKRGVIISLHGFKSILQVLWSKLFQTTNKSNREWSHRSEDDPR